ncbi:unnamed protein product [Notodromas monacha]|uniref:Uncharacterized protein n=1 Tax=Notodromas monacha TaxID=399045 RepID=A0A7R9GJT8_9CRUS|nr:unnamed protein product [Notodromas monacha]CAG0924025.1 unnamed protein product [Notodromas monacha]
MNKMIMECRGAIFAVLFLISAFTAHISDAKQCLVDETRSANDPNNLYDCGKDANCCFENGQPSCCTPTRKMQSSVWWMRRGAPMTPTTCTTAERMPTVALRMDNHLAALRRRPTRQMDQLKLWGGLAGILVLIAIVVLSCRSDIEICKEGTVCCPCCCKPKPHQDDQDPIVSHNRAKNMGPPDFTAPGVHQKKKKHFENFTPTEQQSAPVYHQEQPRPHASPPKPTTPGFAAIDNLELDTLD